MMARDQHAVLLTVSIICNAVSGRRSRDPCILQVMTTLTHLECSLCLKRHDASTAHNLCECGGPLLVRYDLEALRQVGPAIGSSAARRPCGATRPCCRSPNPRDGLARRGHDAAHPHQAPRRALGANDLWVKDEGLNPTGSFKARGLACAISMCANSASSKVAIPSAGNAASAMAAYAAAAGIEAHIFMPQDVPQANFIECKAFGAHVTLVNGLISDCGRIVAERKDAEGWFDVSTLKEPYRIEGKKTMGYEVAEQFGWNLPDAIFYPTGGGVGLIGMWKAFDEMEALGWIGPKRPKMIAVQAEGCAARRARLRTGRRAPSSGRTPRPLPAACGCPSRSATCSSCEPSAPAAAPHRRQRPRDRSTPAPNSPARRHLRRSGRRRLHRRPR